MPVDTMAFLLSKDDSLVTFTEHRDNRGVCVYCIINYMRMTGINRFILM